MTLTKRIVVVAGVALAVSLVVAAEKSLGRVLPPDAIEELLRS